MEEEMKGPFSLSPFDRVPSLYFPLKSSLFACPKKQHETEEE
jgi:hypothetical protein